MSSSPTERSQVVTVTMPQMGVSVADGTIARWLHEPGDAVEADETIVEITTDKIDVEVPAPASGRIARLLAEEGETVAVGEPIAEIDTAPGAGDAAAGESSGGAPAEASQAPSANGSGESRAPAEGSENGAVSTGGEEAAAGGEHDRSGFISPVVQRLAAEHGIDLATVRGTGVGGRIRKRDVLAAISEPEDPEAQTASERPAPTLHSDSPYRPGQDKAEPQAEPAGQRRPGPERVPMSPMRRTIAERMVASRRTAAHVTTVTEVDFSNVLAARDALAEDLASRGVKVTPLAFVAQACVGALLRFPELNSSIDGEEMIVHRGVDLGIAVALEDGLVVPVIADAHRLNLEGMAAAISEVAGRARAGSLSGAEAGDATFTITNPGVFGTILSTPIINPPQVGILDLEAIVPRPVASDGDEEVTVRPLANLCLSFDHRAVDGAGAARFLAAVREQLEEVQP